MKTRTLLISTGISCLIGGIIFMYFKNRMSRSEKKVDLMFQLIQEYEQTKSNNQKASRNPPQNEITMDNINLINVSDDESSDASDSDEVSDDEEEETIHIRDNIGKNNMKAINLEGAETNSFPVDNLDDISDLEENEIDLNNENIIHLQKNDDIKNINNSEIKLEFKEKNEETSDEENLTDDEDVVQDVVEDVVADVVADVVQDVASKVNDFQSNTKQIIPEADNFKDLNVKQLKQICENQGFTNYKALRKNKLIELLQR